MDSRRPGQARQDPVPDLVAVRPPRHVRRPTRLLLRTVFGVAAVCILLLPFVVAVKLYQQRMQLAGQRELSAPTASAADLTRWQAHGATLPAAAPPVVLAYHDIRPVSGDPYIVSPEQFDRQLAALRAAGYRSVSSVEYARYLRGGPIPPRSVYITFDDGTGGLWVWADRILARHGMRASSYLISGRVGRYRPYYLSWQEVERMRASNRWDFQAHTHDLHTQVPTGPDREGSALMNRLWDPRSGRLETRAAYRARIEADTAAMFADFQSRGLPRPELFAYPFSEMSEPSNDPVASEGTRRGVQRRFAAALTNKTKDPQPTSRRAAAGRELGRIELTGSTTADRLLAQVTAWTALRPGGSAPLSRPELWRSEGDETTLETLTTRPQTGHARYQYASYAPGASADWTDYRLSVQVSRLSSQQVGTNVYVRFGSRRPVVLRMSRSSARLVGGPAQDRVLGEARLRPAATHRVEVYVTDTGTVAVIDGTATLRAANTPDPTTRGGFALALRRGRPGLAWPSFTRLTVTDLPPGARLPAARAPAGGAGRR